MSEWQLKTPVAFIIFNRPDTTARVFAEIAKAKPRKLLVIADGPRPSRPGEAEKCAAARAVVEGVDWPCEVLTNYADTNLGCGRRVSSGLDWVFSAEEEAIILEDDCLPHPTFFRFCDELLEKYRDDERVMAVSGDNFQFGRRRTEDSYYFSHYSHIWGWSTWRRAWRHFDFDLASWRLIRDGGWLRDILRTPGAISFWADTFQAIHDKRLEDYWDAQWTLTCWLHNSLSILPNINLVSNIGFSLDATRTRNRWSRVANMPVEAMRFPLRHPPYMIRDIQADDFTQNLLFKRQNWLTRSIKRVAKRILLR